jgi:urate oxidase
MRVLSFLLCFRGTVWDIVLEKFAGPYDKGEYSPSVQKTLYDIQVLSLSQLPEVCFVTYHSED